MAVISDIKAFARKTDGTAELLAAVNVRSDSLYHTVYAWNGRAIGTIVSPFPGYPHYRKNWQAFDTNGNQLSGLIVGARGGLRKVTRNAFPKRDGIHILPELESSK